MKKCILLLLSVTLLSGCNTVFYHLYSPVKSNGVDFSKGRWLIGNIETNANIKAELNDVVYADFSEILGNRIGEVRNETLLIAPKIPLNPTKTELDRLKKGTNYDYFINIKSRNESSDLDNFQWADHNYYKLDVAWAAVAMEIYDLNTGTIIYTQTASGRLDKSMSMTSRPTAKVILGCYKKVQKDLLEKSTH